MSEEMGDPVGEHGFPITDGSLMHPPTDAGKAFWGRRPESASVHVTEVPIPDR